MVIGEQDNPLEMLCLEVLPPDSPGAGDMRLQVRVRSHGFSGETAVWIDAKTFHSFLGHLRVLNTRREGFAEVRAMSPEDFCVRIQTVDRAGHMVVEGRVARCVLAFWGCVPLLHSVQFGFEFCPSLLPALITKFESLAEVQS